MQMAAPSPTPIRTSALTELIARLVAEGPVFCGEVAAQRRTHPATVSRWMLRGIHGPSGGRVKLEHYRQAGKLVTSWPAVDRFFAALQAQNTDAAIPPRSPG
jgi:hypothetical protein